MRSVLSFTLVLVLAAGCVSKSGARLREREAFVKGQQQAITAQQQAQEPVVWFRGLIRHSRVPWSEGLLLTQALVAAEYTGAFNPAAIRVSRRGRSLTMDVKLLLRGEEDLELEPGDIVDVLR